MTKIHWDGSGERLYETGVDRGVLYKPNNSGVYTNGVPWNGLVSVTESPSGAESSAQYADNLKYLNLTSAEEFGASIEAFTYPDEFAEHDGVANPASGVAVGQQNRKPFGLSYRTKLGNDVHGDDHGYKIHLVYGAMAAPSEKAYTTVNDSPEAITFSWEVTTTPVLVPNLKSTSIITINSTQVSGAALSTLEDLLYGTVGSNPSLPLPAAVITIFGAGLTLATPTQPTYNAGTKVITIPAISGVEYYMDDVLLTAGAQPAITEDKIVVARPAAGYRFPPVVDVDWLFDF